MPETREEKFLTHPEIEKFEKARKSILKMVNDFQEILVQHIKDVDNGTLQQGINSLVEAEMWLGKAMKAK